MIEDLFFSEREKKLNEAIETLKKEFIGLDSILDEIKECISTYYLTPFVNTRPVVISLWGMTGTGKSSVVRRLIELLDLNNSSMFFDCGECRNSNKDLISNISDSFGFDIDSSTNFGKDLVFVFDEFQYARTINEVGREETVPSLRPIWSLLDNGILNINDNYSWEYNRLVSFIEDFIPVAESEDCIKVENNRVNNVEDAGNILKSLGYLYYGSEYEGEETEPKAIKQLIPVEFLRTILKRCNNIRNGYGIEVLGELIDGVKTIREVSDKLKEVQRIIQKPKEVDCRKSLVFVIGNLDEAFNVSEDLNPDMSADAFYDMTTKVTISDIKEALKKRFRPEQIARLGNNLIKYPTLNEMNFRKIIKSELGKILDRVKEKYPNINITVTKDIEELLFSEGVYPTQGVRPLFTTINTIINPYISKIITEKYTSKNLITNAEIGIKDSQGFKVPSVEVYIKYLNNGEEVKTNIYNQNLQLGAIRNPKKRIKRYICSVHEVGHAVVYTWLTGNVPDSIVSVSINRGGFCYTRDKDTSEEIKSRKDIDNEVMICLGGYLAEELIYDDPDMRLMGSGSDLNSAWNIFSNAVFKLGYFEPTLFSSWEVDTGCSGIPSGFDISNDYNKTLENAKIKFTELESRARNILREEVELIKQTAKVLGDKGSITGEEFKEFIKKYGNCISKVKKTNYDYYLEKLN